MSETKTEKPIRVKLDRDQVGALLRYGTIGAVAVGGKHVTLILTKATS
jgi:hypothetical protein